MTCNHRLNTSNSSSSPLNTLLFISRQSSFISLSRQRQNYDGSLLAQMWKICWFWVGKPARGNALLSQEQIWNSCIWADVKFKRFISVVWMHFFNRSLLFGSTRLLREIKSKNAPWTQVWFGYDRSQGNILFLYQGCSQVFEYFPCTVLEQRSSDNKVNNTLRKTLTICTKKKKKSNSCADLSTRRCNLV